MTTVHARVTILVSSAVLSLTTLTGPAMAAQIPDGPGTPTPAASPVCRSTSTRARKSTQPVYDYANAIRESVYVDTTMDTDSDGQDDVIAVDIVRPSETAAHRQEDPGHHGRLAVLLLLRTRQREREEDVRRDGVIQKMPLYYDNYFVPRGYAMVGVDIVGTGRSDRLRRRRRQGRDRTPSSR